MESEKDTASGDKQSVAFPDVMVVSHVAVRWFLGRYSTWVRFLGEIDTRAPTPSVVASIDRIARGASRNAFVTEVIIGDGGCDFMTVTSGAERLLIFLNCRIE